MSFAGSISLRFIEDPGELADTCSIDVAEANGGLTLAEVSEVLGVTKERVRQLEEKALRKLEPLVENL